jgi:hypothetical protein
MSQTETILLVVLGFSLASLIALFIGRMMWRIALKLGARRMQRQVPSSLIGLQTERDRLRAEYAMLAQRLGARLEAATLKMTEQMAEVIRHRNRLAELERAAAGRDSARAEADARIASLERRLADAEARQAELRQVLAAKEEALRKLLRPQRTEHPAIAMPAPDDAVPPPANAGGARLRAQIGKLQGLADAADAEPPVELPQLLEAEPPPDPLLIEKLAEAERETADLQKELEQLDAEWSRSLAEQPSGPAMPAPESPPDAPVANVISLAARIRELKKGLADE